MKEMMELPRLSLKERDRRWGVVREAMKTQGLDCLVIAGRNSSWDQDMANVRYLTHIGGNGTQAYVIFPLKEEPTAITFTSNMLPWLKIVQDWVTDIRVVQTTWSGAMAGRLKELGLEKGNIGVVGLGGILIRDGVIPYETYAQLLKELPQANFVNVTPMMEELRLIKSPEEIQWMEKSGEIGDLMLDAMVKTAEPGVKEYEVFARMIEAEISNGGEYPTMLLMCAGAEPITHPFMKVPGYVLQEGDILSIEMHPNYGGYLLHQERTISLGEPKKEYRFMYDVALKCFDIAMSKLVPGVDWNEAIKAMRQPIFDAGLSFVEAGVQGHGLGSPEYPNIQFPPGKAAPELVASPVRLYDYKVQANMCIAVMFDLMDMKWKDGKTGIMMGDTVVVTETGGRRLGKYTLDTLAL